MPIYEYVCETCGEKFERWSTKIRDSEWTELCPHDGGTGKRIISTTSFILKGPRWAKDGYGGNNSGSTKGKPKQEGN